MKKGLKWLNRQKFDKERLNAECEICGRTFYILEVHHIDGNRENNDPKNYLFICGRCHKLVHTGRIKIPREIKSRLINPEKKLLVGKYRLLLRNGKIGNKGLNK